MRRLRHLGLAVAENTPENATHAHRILKLAELGILNLDNMALAHLLRQRSFDFARDSISSHVLLSLIEQCRQSLRHLGFWQVELNSGTWEGSLSRIKELTNLLSFSLTWSGYTEDGTNSHLRPNLPRPRPSKSNRVALYSRSVQIPGTVIDMRSAVIDCT